MACFFFLEDFIVNFIKQLITDIADTLLNQSPTYRNFTNVCWTKVAPKGMRPFWLRGELTGDFVIGIEEPRKTLLTQSLPA